MLMPLGNRDFSVHILAWRLSGFCCPWMCNTDAKYGERLRNLQRRPTNYHCDGSWQFGSLERSTPTSKGGLELSVDIGEECASTALRRAEIAECLCASKFWRILHDPREEFHSSRGSYRRRHLGLKKTHKQYGSRLNAQSPSSQRAKK
jgi:hypothetical protein